MKFLTMALGLFLLPLTAQAQVPINGDLTVSISPQRYRICNDRPERPAWAEELPQNQAWRGLTLRALYEFSNFQAILASEDCSCATRFPAWRTVDAEYEKILRMLSAPEHTRVQRELRRKAALLRPAVETICRAQGNW